MKKLIFLGLCFSSLLMNSQNIIEMFPNFDKRGMNTSILYNNSSIHNIRN